MIEPECRGGYTLQQIELFLGESQYRVFEKWIYGQTMMLCEQDPQREWVDDPAAIGGQRLIEVGPSLCERAHGPVVYPWDFYNFLKGGPILD